MQASRNRRSRGAKGGQNAGKLPQFRQNGRIFQKFNEIRASDLPIMQRGFLVPGDGLKRTARVADSKADVERFLLSQQAFLFPQRTEREVLSIRGPRITLLRQREAALADVTVARALR